MTDDVTPPPHHLGGWNREQVAAFAPETLLVLPIGATEQHGPHLPLGTDYALVESVLAQALAVASPPRPVAVAPTLPYGNSQHHLFACAGSFSSTTLAVVLADLVASFVRSGFRRILILNGHGGNDHIARVAATDAATVHTGVFAAANYWAFAIPEASDPAPDHLPGHAGGFEAAMLLAARPDLMPGGAAPADVPGPPGILVEHWGADVTVARSGDWAASGGFTDSPGTATAGAGRAHLAATAGRLARFLEKLAAVPVPDEIRPGNGGIRRTGRRTGARRP